jgi:hypothetical protein
MKAFKSSLFFCALVFPMGMYLLSAQVPSGVYRYTEQADGANTVHEVKLKDGYLIYSVFENDPPKFVKTLGGFFNTENDSLVVQLEFNSDHDSNPGKRIAYSYGMEGKDLVLNGKTLRAQPAVEQALDGMWLFATRGPDTGQERRGDSNPRKTLKLLLDGHFQWIAYQTDTMEFSGTGGGTFTAENGTYTENIIFFSRDNSRVGASLQFKYEIDGSDWHHKGQNSKGEPMYEVWERRGQPSGSR